MNTIKTQELKIVPSDLTDSFNNNKYILITHNGKPYGVVLPFNIDLMEQGLISWMALKAFETGDMSLGQLADSLGKNKVETLKMLGQFHIPVADYNLQEDIDAIKKL
ncbi:hypothetical protein PN36_34635 [Candidatus Thiomargarita nelsonii]|uniref:Prevent-host-death family protein n=1 Tax=Candidatus Thiomargarita nelsonii TaxID=1003181 RepID=A0A0A6PDT9_9GAMM|nr:hypothetical protein PN36_34635 [Candidatus Thiomargarita nelsonii]